MVISEGDLAGLIMMIIFRELTGASPFFAEWGEYDLKNNAILFMGHGISSPALAKSPKEVLLTRTP